MWGFVYFLRDRLEERQLVHALEFFDRIVVVQDPLDVVGLVHEREILENAAELDLLARLAVARAPRATVRCPDGYGLRREAERVELERAERLPEGR